MRKLCYIEKNNRPYLKETTIRKYYKTVTIEKNWVRPNLSSNGTMGGNAFACGGTYSHAKTGTTYIYQLFDGNTSSGPTACDYNGGSCVDFYNPIPIKVSKIQASGVTYAGDWYGVAIYGSNDYSNWTLIQSYSHGLCTACVIDNPQSYKYYRLYNTTGFAHDNSGYGGGLGELYITATYETTTTEECTNDDDWTSCKDFVTYKAFLKG